MLFPVVDWHALTTHYEDTASIAEKLLQVMMDWLSVGLDPRKSTLFIQSRVLEHAELHLILSMITPLGWLERVPTYKEIIENLKDRDLGTYGFLGYPLLQSADIVIYTASRGRNLRAGRRRSSAAYRACTGNRAYDSTRISVSGKADESLSEHSQKL